MSTKNRFRTALIAVVTALLVLGGAGAAASLIQGPRVSAVSADPDSAIRSSGTRVVITANQTLEEIDASQVEVTPATDVTIDASGRTVGVRFSAPLNEDTEYTVTVRGARGVGGGASADLTATLTTPAAAVYLLRRSVSGDDTIYRATLHHGKTSDETVVFTHPHIEDFRRTSDGLVISLVEDETARVVSTDADGKDVTEIRLPGPGSVMRLEVSDRSSLVGYLFSDIGIEGGGGNESRLYISSLKTPDKEPRALVVGDEAVSVDHWRFVPDSSSLLALHFGGDVVIADPTTDAAPAVLGAAIAIQNLSRGGYTATLLTNDGRMLLDLRSGTQTPLELPESLGETDTVDTVLPLPNEKFLWQIARRDEAGMPLRTSFVVTGPDGEKELIEGGVTDPVLQFCTSPSGDRLALTVSPDHLADSYDMYAQPLPQKVRTRLYSMDTGERVGDLSGFDLSWCARGPF